MTVASSVNPQFYDGNGSQTVFIIPWTVRNAAWIEAGWFDAAGVWHQKLNGSEFTVALNGATWQLTFNAAPPAGVKNVAIVRKTPGLQTVNFKDLRRFPAENTETMGDRLAEAIQDLAAALNTVFRLSPTDFGKLAPMDPLSGAVGKFWTIVADPDNPGGYKVSFSPSVAAVEATSAIAAEILVLAGISDEIVAVAEPGAAAAIATIAPSIASVVTAANSITAIGIVSFYISNVNTVATNIASVNALVPQIAKIVIAADGIADITLVADDLALGPAASFILRAPQAALDADAAKVLAQQAAAATVGSATAAASSATAAAASATAADASSDLALSHAAAAVLAGAVALGQVFATGRAAVKSRTTAAQPASPANQDIYILPALPTGAQWSGFSAGDVVKYFSDGASWVRAAPAEGWTAYVQDTNDFVLYDGAAWVSEFDTEAATKGVISGSSDKKAAITRYIRELMTSRVADLRDWADFDFSGASDNASSFTTALTQARTAKTPVYAPTGVIALGSTITLPEGTRLIGAGNQTPDWQTELNPSGLISSGASGRSTIFHIAHTGIGFATNALDGVILEDFATFRTQPDPTSSFMPTDHGFDFDLLGANDSELRRLTLINPTRGIRSRSNATMTSGRHTLIDIDMHAMLIGVQVQQSYDVHRMSRVHCWPFWSNHANVEAWMKANLVAFFSARNDNPQWNDLFSIWHLTGLHIANQATIGDGSVSPGGTTFKAKIVNSDFDLGQKTIYFSPAVDGATVYLANVTGEGLSSAGTGIFVDASSNCRITATNLSLRNFHGNAVRIFGSNNKISIADFNGEGSDRANSGFPTIECDAGNEVNLVGSAYLNNAGQNVQTGGSGAIFLPARKRLSANLTLYVRTDGNDANDGFANTAARAFLTPQAAVKAAQGLYAKNGFDVTVQLPAATYTSPLNVIPSDGGGKLILRGDPTNYTTAASYLFSTTSSDAITIQPGASVQIDGISVTTTTGGHGIRVEEDAELIVGTNNRLQACVNSRIYNVGKLFSRGSFRFSGNGQSGIECVLGGQCDIAGTAITFDSTPVFSNGFLVADRDAHIDAYSITYSGSFTGGRANIGKDASLFTNGEPESAIPGSAPVGVSRTGSYNDRMGDIVPDAVTSTGLITQVGKNIPYALFQSGAFVSHTGTATETTIYTIAIPAGAMGPNGSIEVEGHFLANNTANSKRIRLKLGGVEVMNYEAANGARGHFRKVIANRNAQNSQSIFDPASPGGFGVSTAAYSDPAVDTSASVNLTVTVALATSTETLSFLFLSVKLIHGA